MAETSQQHGTGSLVDLVPSFFQKTGLTPVTALTLFSFAVISMGGFMFSHSITIDDELALFNGDPWGASYQGRFLYGVYNAFAGAGGVVPLLPHLLLACSYVISYSLILHCHELRHTWRTNLAFLVFILYPVNWLNQEFTVLTGSLAVALPLTCLAAYLSIRKASIKASSAWWRNLSWLAVGLLIIAISGYQSIVTLYFAICTGSLLFHATPSTQANPTRNPVSGRRKGLGIILLFGVTALLASLAQLTIVKAFLAINNAQIQHVNVYFRSPYFMLRTEPWQYILGNCEQLLRTYATPGFFYGSSFFSIPLILVGAYWSLRHALLISETGCAKRLKEYSHDFELAKGLKSIALIAILLVAPLALNAISIPYRIPMRALLALPYVAWLATIIWLELSGLHGSNRSRLISVLLTFFLIMQCLVAVSHYYAARAFNTRSDQLVAASIASAISQANPERSTPVRWLASDGFLKREVPYRTAWYSTAGASFFSWDHGSDARITAWLRAMGVQGLKPVNTSDRPSLAPEFARMMAWPNPGSIRVEGDTVLIKFSEPEP